MDSVLEPEILCQEVWWMITQEIDPIDFCFRGILRGAIAIVALHSDTLSTLALQLKSWFFLHVMSAEP